MILHTQGNLGLHHGGQQEPPGELLLSSAFRTGSGENTPGRETANGAQLGNVPQMPSKSGEKPDYSAVITQELNKSFWKAQIISEPKE